MTIFLCHPVSVQFIIKQYKCPTLDFFVEKSFSNQSNSDDDLPVRIITLYLTLPNFNKSVEISLTAIGRIFEGHYFLLKEKTSLIFKKST